jgi:tetratricopeptide (TPR) repeat protein
VEVEVDWDMASVLDGFGRLYEKQNFIPEAIEYWKKCLKIREEIADKQGASDAMEALGILFSKAGLYLRAQAKAGFCTSRQFIAS